VEWHENPTFKLLKALPECLIREKPPYHWNHFIPFVHFSLFVVHFLALRKTLTHTLPPNPV
jgi:hypothetical protein